jgi:hypothetical protein
MNQREMKLWKLNIHQHRLHRQRYLRLMPHLDHRLHRQQQLNIQQVEMETKTR